MRIDEELAQASQDQDSALTIGVFDGGHRGHRHLMARLAQRAKAEGLLSGVVTFRNHPASVLRSDFKPRYLTSLEDRVALIRELGIDLVAVVTFDQDLANLSAKEFALRLKDHLRMRGLMVGPDFAMGHAREGSTEALAVMGQELGFWVEVVDLLAQGGKPIKSTAIRDALAQGDVTVVRELLGRDFSLTGTVATGERRGRTLGFPTANLETPEDMATPGDGIYATRAVVGDRAYMAATSIGVRPTFGEGRRTIEAFLLDFDGDLYGQDVRLEFVRRLRDEIKYDTMEALLEQVDKDVVETRMILEATQREV